MGRTVLVDVRDNNFCSLKGENFTSALCLSIVKFCFLRSFFLDSTIWLNLNFFVTSLGLIYCTSNFRATAEHYPIQDNRNRYSRVVNTIVIRYMV